MTFFRTRPRATITDMLTLLNTADRTTTSAAIHGDFFINRKNMDAFLNAILTGAEVPTHTILDLRLHRSKQLTAGLNRNPRWSASSLIPDDEFTGTRFLLWWKHNGNIEARHGIAQLVRMLADNRVDLDFTRNCINSTNLLDLVDYPDTWAAATTYLAYDSLIWSMTVQSRSVFALTHGNHAAKTNFFNRLINDAWREKQDLFRHVWLPALVPADEYTAVKHLPDTMLQDFYASLFMNAYPQCLTVTAVAA